METTLAFNENLPNFKKIENINPNDYTIIGMFWKEQIGDNEWEIEFDLDRKYDLKAFNQSHLCSSIINLMHHKKSRCNHCNKMIQYVMLGINVDGTLNLFGHKCTENIQMYKGLSFESVQKRSLSSMVSFKNKEKRNSFLEAHVGLEEALKSNNKLVVSIRENFIKYMKLSDKQIELVFKMSAKQKEFDIKNTERESLSGDVPETRIVNEEFKLISVKRENTDYGDDYVFKCVIENKLSLYRVYGNLPKNLFESDEDEPIKIGDTLSLSATLTKSGNNPKFGFFKRAKITT